MNIRSIQVHDLLTVSTAHGIHVLRVCEIEIASAGDGQSIAEFATTVGGAGYTLRATSPHESALTRWSAPTWQIANDGSSQFSNVEFIGWQHHSALEALAAALPIW